MLNSMRETMNNYIDENSYTIVTYLRPLIDNGFGIQVPDLTKVAVEQILGTARISRRRLPDPIVTNAKTPYDYLDSYYLFASHDSTWLREGIVFEYYDQKFKTLFVEKRIIDHGIAYRLCNLEQVTSRDIGDNYV